ncbi:sigma-70 family RNA polymerase sigma factor [Hespellia stercorisuis]|uniref:RNA polymerase sigma factor, sigma-70 family n=1 Tax=Hespellia stercorisuis DSM 15480 TaxID=1121950 RepID=A0A1M6SEQ7_9FIRM|nr:sigma-70 family RNA polymerase sigma factor [Hespellia stercorisuis]SHK43165.1 RNA polymerase sigma factor, sigma-70 family [Hespellia stercorisuis DSM 15480]
MSAPLSENTENTYLIEMFDSFSKVVLKNELLDLLRKRKNDYKESVASEKTQYLFEQQEYVDTYPSDSFYLEGIEKTYHCNIYDARLYYAMKELPLKKRTMLIMNYWYGLTDVEIARYFEVSTKTIYNWRRNAFKRIRYHYERGSP